MSSDLLLIDRVEHRTSRLIDPEKSETIKDSRIDFLAAVSNNANNNLSKS